MSRFSRWMNQIYLIKDGTKVWQVRGRRNFLVALKCLSMTYEADLVENVTFLSPTDNEDDEFHVIDPILINQINNITCISPL